MLRRITAKQFQQWEHYAVIDPLEGSERRADWRTALICKYLFDTQQRVIQAVLAAGGIERHKRPKFVDLELKDFVLQWEESTPKPPKKKQTWQEQWEIIEMIMHATEGGAVDAQTSTRPS